MGVQVLTVEHLISGREPLGDHRAGLALLERHLDIQSLWMLTHLAPRLRLYH